MISLRQCLLRQGEKFALEVSVIVNPGGHRSHLGQHALIARVKAVQLVVDADIWMQLVVANREGGEMVLGAITRRVLNSHGNDPFCSLTQINLR